MADTETLETTKTKKKCVNRDELSDFPSMGVDLIKKINFKVALFIFLIGIIVLSDVFIEKLPADYQDGTGNPNTKGAIAQLSVITVFYIIVDLLVQGNIL